MINSLTVQQWLYQTNPNAVFGLSGRDGNVDRLKVPVIVHVWSMLYHPLS